MIDSRMANQLVFKQSWYLAWSRGNCVDVIASTDQYI